MTTKEILQLDRIEEYREGNQLEVKAAQGGMPDSLWDSYSAFANTDGGCILLGVKEYDDHSLHVVGLKDAEKMKKDFWNAVNNRQKISVNLMTEHRVHIENVDGKDIIVLEVPRAERTSRPVYKGMDPRKGTYRRNHEGDYLCSIEEVSALFRENHVYHTPAEIREDVGVDRVFVSLPNGGHEQDVKAMLELYDHPEELTFPEVEVSKNGKTVDKLAIKQIIGDKLAAIRQKESNIGDNDAILPKIGDKLPIRDEIIDKLADIVVFLSGTKESNSTAISQLIGKGISTTKNYLTLLISLGLVEAHGGNKNRTYSKKQ
jgi:hypothetical protein